MGNDPKNIQRCLNSARFRRQVARQRLRFLVAGATGVDGLCAELRKWFIGIVELRAPIVMLKLRIFLIFKLMCFSRSQLRNYYTIESDIYNVRFVLYTGAD